MWVMGKKADELNRNVLGLWIHLEMNRVLSGGVMWSSPKVRDARHVTSHWASQFNNKPNSIGLPITTVVGTTLPRRPPSSQHAWQQFQISQQLEVKRSYDCHQHIAISWALLVYTPDTLWNYYRTPPAPVHTLSSENNTKHGGYKGPVGCKSSASKYFHQRCNQANCSLLNTFEFLQDLWTGDETSNLDRIVFCSLRSHWRQDDYIGSSCIRG